MSFDATFIRRLALIDLWFSIKFRQRGILKYLIFVPSRALFSLYFVFFRIFNSHFFFIYFLINVNFVYKIFYLIKILFVHILLFSLFLISILTISNSPSTVFFSVPIQVTVCPNWPHLQHKLRNIPIQSQNFCIFQTNPNLKSTL